MKILLINPPDENTVLEFAPTNSEEERFVETEDYGAYPPLGLLYVATYLKNKFPEYEVKVSDCVAERRSHESLKELVRDFKPDVVGITSFTISLIDVVMAAKTVKEISPNTHVCLGGHHPIAFPYEATRLKEFDSVVVGEGEYAFAELVSSIENSKDITKILGVYTRESAEEYKNESIKDKRFLGKISLPPAYVDDLDDLPVLDRNFIKHINYRNPVGKGDRLATIITTRGCPYLCTYCDVPYKKYRTRSIESVLDEVEHCLELGYNEFHFYDDLFNITSTKVIEFCDAVERRGIKFSWDFRGRVNAVTRESLIRAKKAGCRLISFGVETGSDEAYKIIKKGTSTAKVKEVFEWCHEYGILTVADYMIGFPFEKTPDDIRKSIDFLLSIKPDYTIIAILMLLPNTEIYYEGVRKGQVDPDKWKNFSLDPLGNSDFTIDFWEEHMTRETLYDLRMEAYSRFYMRPGYFLSQIASIRSMYEFRTRFLGLMAILRSIPWLKQFIPSRLY
jgi:radical SAM superfamily enzyme YgiQ (UPF0313 family)